jgi:hypothetical protein
MLPLVLQILFTVFENVFGFWPLLLLAPLQNRRSGIRNMVYVWGVWAIIRILLFFNPQPLSKPITIIQEPLNTLLFFGTGFILIAIWIGLSFWRRSRI